MHRKEPKQTTVSAGGFALPTILIFMFLLSLTAFAGAFLVRTDMQVMNNDQNEKKALYIAEAGMTEALLRLRMTSPANMTVNGVTFDAAIRPQGDNTWKGYILFAGTGPATSSSVFTTPTIQPTASRLLYSSSSIDSDAIQFRWALNPDGTMKSVRGDKVLEIVSTGRSGKARRTIVMQLLRSAPLAVHVHNPTACDAWAHHTNALMTVGGSVQVNSSCATAMHVFPNSSVTSLAGDINVVGGFARGTPSKLYPTPFSGAPWQEDPLVDLQPPCFKGYSPASGCTTLTPDPPVRNGSKGKTTPLLIDSGQTATLDPGIYYGGILIRGTVTMRPGIYITPSGEFTVEQKGSVTGNGVMIFNTDASASGKKVRALSISGNGQGTVNLTPPTSGPFAGVIIYQDREMVLQPSIYIAGRWSGTIEGMIYGIKAKLELNGKVTLGTQFVVDLLDINNHVVIVPTDNPYFPAINGGYAPIAWSDL